MLALCLIIAGCKVTPIEVSQFDIVKTEGFIAFMVAATRTVPFSPQPDVVSGCTCNGTKVVKQFDGHVTQCPCGDNCKCKQSGKPDDVQPINKPVKRVMLFTDPKNCSPCRKFEKDEVPTLKKKDWTVGKDDDNLIQVIDLKERENADVFKKYGVTQGIPTFILFEQEKEVRRYVGFMTANEFTDWFYAK